MSTLKVREADILRSIVDYLKLRRVFFWRQNAGGYKTDAGHFIHYGTKGVPDICVIKAGFIGLEVKRPGGKQSPDQKLFEEALIAAGGRYHVVDSIDEVVALGL